MMSKVNLFAVSVLVFTFTQGAAFADNENPAQESAQDGSGHATEGNGSTVWPDIWELIDGLITPPQGE